MTAESSLVIFQQVLVPFWLAGLGTVTAGMVLDEIQVSADTVYVLIHLCLNLYPVLSVFFFYFNEFISC